MEKTWTPRKGGKIVSKETKKGNSISRKNCQGKKNSTKKNKSKNVGIYNDGATHYLFYQ